MKRVLLCVDLSNQVHIALNSHMGLTSGTTFTGGLYGFIVGLCSAIKETRATHVVVGADRRPYIRSRDYPDYKKFRKHKDELSEEKAMAISQSFKLIEEFLSEVAIPVWSVPGFEYDDLAAHCVFKYHRRWDEIIAWSNDSDLHQLLAVRNFSLFGGKKKGFYTRRDFDVEWKGIHPNELPLALSLTGTHNDVEGIKGVGPATAIKALKDPAVMRELRNKHGKVIDRNRPLIKLPHDEFPFSELIPVTQRGGVNTRALYRWCSRYDIEVTKHMVDALEQVLK